MSAHWTEKDLAAVRERLHGEKHSPLRSKFRNVSMEVEGFKFDSKLEMRRFGELQTMQAGGLISELKVHPEFALHAPTSSGQLERVGSYIADFSYQRNGKLCCEDCKSAPTRRLAMFRWKVHHLKLEYNLDVIEISRRHREPT